jgi:hypothetical protein
VSDFDELKRWAIDSQMTLGDIKRLEKVRELSINTLGDVEPVAPSMLAPAFFFKACASLRETADRFATMFGYEEIALYELLPRLRNESLPTIWRCYDPRTVEGELLVLPGHPFWTRRNVSALRAMLEKLTKLGATPDGQPLKICGVFTCRQRLDAMCPLPTTGAEDQDRIEYVMIRDILKRAPNTRNYNQLRISAKVLVNTAREGLEAECQARGRPDLIGYLDKGAVDKVRRAIGRKP